MDLDEIIYLMSSKNRSSMGYWFHEIVNEIRDEAFFKIPKTTIIKVPMLLSQLICLGYDTINKITLDIVNEYCYKVCHHLKEIIRKCNLSGQWSIDIMQNGNEFYIIDMQEAQNSTYYKETVSENLRKPTEECWISNLSSSESLIILRKKVRD